MYKVFINDRPLILTNTASVGQYENPKEKTLKGLYLGKSKFLFQYIDLLEKSSEYDKVILYHDDVELLWAHVRDIFTTIEAAGGVVYNSDDEILVIYRLKTWDLPKGKIDPGESPEEAAVREVQEETGLFEVHLGRFLTHTYHTYQHKGKRILKKTHWYAMRTPERRLLPQYSEDIERAEWVDLDAFLDINPIIYNSILDVLKATERF